MSGRKSRKPRTEVPHVPEPIAEENHHFEAHVEQHMDVVHHLGVADEMVMEEVEEEIEMDVGKKKPIKKKKKPAYAFFVAVRTVSGGVVRTRSGGRCWRALERTLVNFSAVPTAHFPFLDF